MVGFITPKYAFTTWHILFKYTTDMCSWALSSSPEKLINFFFEIHFSAVYVEVHTYLCILCRVNYLDSNLIYALSKATTW